MNGADTSKIFDLGPQDVARASFEQMNEISRRAESSRMAFVDPGVQGGNMNGMQNGMQGMQNGMNQNGGMGGMQGMNQGGNMGSNGMNQSNQQNMGSNQGGMSSNQGTMANGMNTPMNAPSINGKPVQSMTREEVLGRVEDLQRERPDQQPFTHSSFLPMLNSQMFEQQRKEEESHKGLQVITLGHLVPRNGAGGNNDGMGMEYQQQQQQQQQQGPHHPQQQQQPQPQMQHPQDMNIGPYSPPANYHGPTPAAGPGPSTAGPSPKSLRVRRTTYVPGWAVPPRVLLVDDDAVNLRLSKKFLQVFGCMIDVAVDGVGAVDKMNLEKYDLVLMVSSLAFGWVVPGRVLLSRLRIGSGLDVQWGVGDIVGDWVLGCWGVDWLGMRWGGGWEWKREREMCVEPIESAS